MFFFPKVSDLRGIPARASESNCGIESVQKSINIFSNVLKPLIVESLSLIPLQDEKVKRIVEFEQSIKIFFMTAVYENDDENSFDTRFVLTAIQKIIDLLNLPKSDEQVKAAGLAFREWFFLQVKGIRDELRGIIIIDIDKKLQNLFYPQNIIYSEFFLKSSALEPSSPARSIYLGPSFKAFDHSFSPSLPKSAEQNIPPVSERKISKQRIENCIIKTEGNKVTIKLLKYLPTRADTSKLASCIPVTTEVLILRHPNVKWLKAISFPSALKTIKLINSTENLTRQIGAFLEKKSVKGVTVDISKDKNFAKQINGFRYKTNMGINSSEFKQSINGEFPEDDNRVFERQKERHSSEKTENNALALTFHDCYSKFFPKRSFEQSIIEKLPKNNRVLKRPRSEDSEEKTENNTSVPTFNK